MSGAADRSENGLARRRLERWEFFMERIGRSHNQTFVFEEVDPDDVGAVRQVVEAMTRNISRHLGSRHWEWWVDGDKDVWINAGRLGRGHLFVTETGRSA